MSSAAPVAPIEEKPLSEAERIVDTFVAPSKTFTDLRRSARWIVPWLLMAITGIALVYTVDSKLGMEKVVENGLALAPKQAAQLDKLSPDARAAQMEKVVKFNRIIAYTYPVVILIFLCVVAAVLLGTFNFGLGTELRFNQCLAVCIYASLPGVVKTLLAILVVAMGAGAAFTFQNPVASNLSPLIDPGSHFLYSVATSIDVFAIWTMVLTGIAFSCLTKVKRGTCMAVVFGWWLLVVLVGGGISAAFS
jgi:hypothetical protein